MAWKPDYATVAQLSSFLRITDDDDDAQLGIAISAASRAIDLHTNRQFGKVSSSVARYYTAYKSGGSWILDIDDIQDDTGFEVYSDGGSSALPVWTATTDFTLKPLNAEADGMPWTQLRVPASGDYKVVGVWGWTSVPTSVVEATLLQASRLFTRRYAPFGVAGSPDAGSEIRLMDRVDPDVAVSLRPYLRWWGAA